MEFSSIPDVSLETLAAIDQLGFKYMTPVQASTINLFLKNKVKSVKQFSMKAFAHISLFQ